MKTKTIKAGYRLTVTTWENDADNYNTEIVEGLSKELCKLYVAICKAFEHSSDYDNRICNMYEPDEEEIARFNTAMLKIGREFESVIRMELFDGEQLPADGSISDEDLLGVLEEDLSNLGIHGGDFFTRVVSAWSVEHVPADIVLTDVTEEFK